jgi:hypothetical protein
MGVKYYDTKYRLLPKYLWLLRSNLPKNFQCWWIDLLKIEHKYFIWKWCKYIVFVSNYTKAHYDFNKVIYKAMKSHSYRLSVHHYSIKTKYIQNDCSLNKFRVQIKNYILRHSRVDSPTVRTHLSDARWLSSYL